MTGTQYIPIVCGASLTIECFLIVIVWLILGWFVMKIGSQISREEEAQDAIRKSTENR